MASDQTSLDLRQRTPHPCLRTACSPGRGPTKADAEVPTTPLRSAGGIRGGHRWLEGLGGGSPERAQRRPPAPRSHIVSLGGGSRPTLDSTSASSASVSNGAPAAPNTAPVATLDATSASLASAASNSAPAASNPAPAASSHCCQTAQLLDVLREQLLQKLQLIQQEITASVHENCGAVAEHLEGRFENLEQRWEVVTAEQPPQPKQFSDPGAWNELLVNTIERVQGRYEEVVQGMQRQMVYLSDTLDELVRSEVQLADRFDSCLREGLPMQYLAVGQPCLPMPIGSEFVKPQSSTKSPTARGVRSCKSTGTSSGDCRQVSVSVLDGNPAAELASAEPSKSLSMTPTRSKGEAAMQETQVVNKDPLRPPPRKSFTAGLQAQELHPWMPRIEQGTLVLILLNTVFIGVELEVSMTHVLRGEVPPAWLEYVDLIFMCAFACEIFLKVCLTRSRFFTGRNRRWNIFDCVLVLTSVIDKVTVTFNLTFLRSLRALRAIWAARMLRSISIIQHLRMMVAAILSSMISLSWALLLLLMLIYLFAVFIMQGVLQSLEYDAELPVRSESVLLSHYGTLGDSIITLFKAISGGIDWGDVAQPLQELHMGYFLCFVLFVIVVTFGILNIVTGVFVEDAKGIANIDKDLIIQQHMDERKTQADTLKTLFGNADTDDSGTLTREELEFQLSSDEAAASLSLLELDVREARAFYDLLDLDGDACVSSEEFVDGLMRLKGPASGVDLAMMMSENKRLYQRLQSYSTRVESNLLSVATHLGIESDMLSVATHSVAPTHSSVRGGWRTHAAAAV